MLTIPFIPVWVLLANIMLNPIYNALKKNIQKKAADNFAKNFKGKVIAVAGSYGKTTTKNYIYELIKYNYKTQMTPGNINTPTGIANWVLQNLKNETEILIVEMDTYFVGEIRRSCKITPPDIAILTNVGDQHLERLGTKENLKKALEEVFKYAKPSAIKIKGHKSNLNYALEVAKILQIPKDIIKDTVKKLQKPDRRGDTKTLHGFKVIDQSYNISETTAKLGLQNALILAKNENKKIAVITAGISELGEENKDGNINYAKELEKSKAEVVLLKSILHKDYVENLDNFILANNLNQAWETVKKEYSPKDYVVLMQPELGDNYY
jgi:UDP-N-acetylmuramyl pentapeptide synthase